MALAPDQELTINRSRDWRELPLTPEDYFLFSRVEALMGTVGPTVGQVIAASGQPPDKAAAILERLVTLGLLSVGDGFPEAPRARAVSGPTLRQSDDLRERARNRRRGLLEAQLRVVRREGEGAVEKASVEKPSEVTSSSAHDESLPTPKAAAAPANQQELRSILDVVPPAAADDPRLRTDIAIPIDLQRKLLGVRDNLRKIDHFELLGLDPVDDPKAIRRAYHVVSRGFHPDAFYGKELGSFRQVLDDLFRRTRASFEFLGDAARRRALVEVHEGRLREHQAELEAERRRAAADRAAAEAAEQREVEAAAREAREARDARDRERKQKQLDRAGLIRRQQARHYASEANDAIEAGRHGNAASLFRLAMEMDPDEPAYEQRWRECLAIARAQRAELSYERAKQARAAGRNDEAARQFAEAADADPSLRNTTDAAAALAEYDPQRAREFALAALEALEAGRSRGQRYDERTLVRTHLACARAFLAAGQVHTAREQAERAHALAPSEHTRALLNAINLA